MHELERAQDDKGGGDSPQKNSTSERQELTAQNEPKDHGSRAAKIDDDSALQAQSSRLGLSRFRPMPPQLDQQREADPDKYGSKKPDVETGRRLGFRLDPACDIYPIAEQIVTINDYVGEMNSNSDHKSDLVFCYWFAELKLQSICTTNGSHRA